MISWLRYARHTDVPALTRAGWRVCADLGPTHGAYAVLCVYDEVWRDVRGYEGSYQVSSHGSVRSLDRVLVKEHARTGYPRRVRGVTLKPGRAGDGYLAVSLSSAEGIKRSRYVAHLVADAFHGARPDGMEVCHNDGDRNNNAAFNLRYGTHIDNEADKIRHGTLMRGNNCPASKLKSADVERIRALRGKSTQADLAREYGVTQSNISMIQSGATWSTREAEPC